MHFRRVVVILVALSVPACAGRPRVSSFVTPDRIRQVSIGMTRSEVETILGPPLRERPGDNDGGILLDYAMEGAAWSSFQLWVYLDRHNHVHEVQAKEYPFVNESYAIYDVRPELPTYEHADFARVVRSQNR